ncbi:MAG: hypothetical protein ACOH1Q_07745 [Thiobacillus sp.]
MKPSTNIAQSQTRPVNSAFHYYMSQNNIGELRSFQAAIAAHAVARTIVLAATGIIVTAITMPDMDMEPHCVFEMPKSNWLYGSGPPLKQVSNCPERFLEYICYTEAGAVAVCDSYDGDYYDDLILGDIEDTFDYLQAFEKAHGVRESIVLAGCTYVTEILCGQYHDLAQTMQEHLLKQWSLCRHDTSTYLSQVRQENLGKKVLATFKEPWINDYADEAHRRYVGSS